MRLTSLRSQTTYDHLMRNLQGPTFSLRFRPTINCWMNIFPGCLPPAQIQYAQIKYHLSVNLFYLQFLNLYERYYEASRTQKNLGFICMYYVLFSPPYHHKILLAFILISLFHPFHSFSHPQAYCSLLVYASLCRSNSRSCHILL